MAKEKIVSLLLGNSEERTSNIIEKLARDVCGDAAVLHIARIPKLTDFIQRGCQEHFDLIIVVVGGLKMDFRPQGSLGPIGEAAQAVSAIKKARPTASIIAFSPHGQYEPALMEAGADHVLEIPFCCDEVKTVLQRMITLEPPVDASSPHRWTFGGELLRTWQRLVRI